MAGACKDDGESVSTQRQHKPSGEVDIVDPDSGGIERSDVGQLEAGDAITLVGDKELILRASGGKANKLVDIGADGVYAALHDGDGVGLPAEPHAAALLGTEFNSHAANFAVMDTCEIGAEDKYLLGAERKRNKWRRRTVNSSRDDGLGWQCASESEKRRGRRNASFQRCFRNLKGMARTDALAIVFDDIRHNDTVHHLLDALVDGRGGNPKMLRNFFLRIALDQVHAGNRGHGRFGRIIGGDSLKHLRHHPRFYIGRTETIDEVYRIIIVN